jgi:BirA family biotin operon repressor/biotin-[acetyl-CoA-carboxylase] ligase
MKAKILTQLKAADGILSGEVLSAKLGISRVSVWKHIRKLRDLGYDIVSKSNGYLLQASPDALYPWEFGDREPLVHYFPQVSSTMDVARDMARKNCPHLTVVVADRQRKGRGRLQRRWRSATGGLYFTIVLRPQIPVVESPKINFTASLALARTLRQMFALDARVKWPNDVLINDKKVAGILSEMEAETDRISFVNIGIGVNVNNDPTPLEPMADSLGNILGQPQSRRLILSAFLSELEERLEPSNFSEVIAEWKHLTVTLNRSVRIATVRETSEGMAVDIDDNGSLILQTDDGRQKTIFYGDCFHV